MTLVFIPLTIKNSFGSRTFTRPGDIVWMHQLAGGGTVLCHTRGTLQVEETIDQITREIPHKFCVFTLEADPKPIAVHVAPRHIRLFEEDRRDGNAVTITTSRGKFKVKQDTGRVLGEIMKATKA